LYARGTKVTVDRSIAELRGIVSRHGGRNFSVTEDDESPRPAVAVLFAIDAKWVRFRQEMPARVAGFDGTGRGLAARRDRRESEVRRRWRVLVLRVKARLEEYRSGLSPFDEVLLPYCVLPDNRTVAEALGPQLEAVYRDGRMPALPAPGRSERGTS
jgi:hypothetical protein